MTRPARKSIPLCVKVIVLERRLKQLLGTERIEYHHNPALWRRDVSEDGTDYVPPQNDPRYIDAVSAEEHSVATNGTPATSLGSDKHEKAKLDRLTGKTKKGSKKPIPPRANSWPPKGTRKIPSRPMGSRRG